jgi:hypothetical protein
MFCLVVGFLRLGLGPILPWCFDFVFGLGLGLGLDLSFGLVVGILVLQF